uniref:Secreted protein n=1 Tax=Meloidogyne hapla TaxID=6305 RepID=A0A1I8BYT8_MELHA
MMFKFLDRIIFIFSFIQISKAQVSANWDINGVVECKENIHGIGEFSFLLQEATIRFYEDDMMFDDDLLKGGYVLTDGNGQFVVKGYAYENAGILEPYLQIDHYCYTPTLDQPIIKGCFYRTVVRLEQKPDYQNVYIFLGIESAKRIDPNGDKELIMETTIFCPPKN